MPAMPFALALALAAQAALSVDPHMIVAIGRQASGPDPLNNVNDTTAG